MSSDSRALFGSPSAVADVVAAAAAAAAAGVFVVAAAPSASLPFRRPGMMTTAAGLSIGERGEEKKQRKEGEREERREAMKKAAAVGARREGRA